MPSGANPTSRSAPPSAGRPARVSRPCGAGRRATPVSGDGGAGAPERGGARGEEVERTTASAGPLPRRASYFADTSLFSRRRVQSRYDDSGRRGGGHHDVDVARMAGGGWGQSDGDAVVTAAGRRGGAHRHGRP